MSKPETDTPKPYDEKLQAIIDKYESQIDPNKPITNFQCCIHTFEDKFVQCKPYIQPIYMMDEVDEIIKELEEMDIIEGSTSAWASPIYCISKKNGKIRMCVDFTQVNKITPKDHFVFPNIDHLIQSFGTIKPKYFTTIDLAKGFHQIEIHPLDRHKTSFITLQHKKQYKRLPFEWINSPAIFQRLLLNILKEEIATGMVQVYFDDIIVFTKDLDMHYKIIDQVFTKLASRNIIIGFDKTEFLRSSCKYLGYIIDKTGVSPNTAIVEMAKQLKPPTNLKEFQKVLGALGWNSKFIPNYANYL